MSMLASLTEYNTATVYSVRTCRCSCGPEVQVLSRAIPAPAHQFDLSALADLANVPVALPCPFCGGQTTADYRAAIVIPTERELAALAHIRPADGDPLYALLCRRDADATGEFEVIASLYDPATWRAVEADEESLVEEWGRPLSTTALIRARLASFSSDPDAIDVVATAAGIAYVFVDLDEDDDHIAAAIGRVDEVAEGFGGEVMMPLEIRVGIGIAGTIVECLGPHRSALSRVGVFGIADADALDRLAREALRAHGARCICCEGKPSERLLQASYRGVGFTVQLAGIGARALLFGHTLAEAADLQVQQSILQLDAFAAATAQFVEAVGERATVEADAEAGTLRILDHNGESAGTFNLGSLLPKEGWKLSLERARELAALALRFGDAGGCPCGQVVALAHLRSAGWAADTGGYAVETITDDMGGSFELVAARDCPHEIAWVSAEKPPSTSELNAGLEHAHFRVEAGVVGIGEVPIAVILLGNAIATMLAHPGLSRRLLRSLAKRMATDNALAWAPTTDTIILAADTDALQVGHAELISMYPQGLPGEPLGFAKHITLTGPACGTVKITWHEPTNPTLDETLAGIHM